MGFETEEIERSLLHTLTNSSMMCRKHMQSVHKEWFSNEYRQFIFQTAYNTFKVSKNLLTTNVFQYEVEKQIDPNNQHYYLGEWNIIQNVAVSDPPDALIDKMREASVGRALVDDVETIIDKAESGDIEEAVNMYKRSAVSLGLRGEEHETREITDYKHRFELLQDKKKHPKKYLGIKTGFPSFDKRTGGLFPGELTLIAGITGVGKSTITKQIGHHIAHEEGFNVLHITNEESQDQVEQKFDALTTEIPYLDFKLATLSDEEIEYWKDMMEKELQKSGKGQLYVREIPAWSDVTYVEQTYRELEAQGIRIHVIAIDHLPHIVPIQKSWSENDEKAKAAADCKQVAKDLNCPVVTPGQAATEVEQKQVSGRRAGKLDIYGSKAQIHVANTFMIITEKGKIPDPYREEYEQDVKWLGDVKKNRDGPNFSFLMRHHVKFGKVTEEKNDGSEELEGQPSIDDDTAKEAAEVADNDAPDDVQRMIDKPVEGSDNSAEGVQSQSAIKSFLSRNRNKQN